jgi:hypothetical protein
MGITELKFDLEKSNKSLKNTLNKLNSRLKYKSTGRAIHNTLSTYSMIVLSLLI